MASNAMYMVMSIRAAEMELKYGMQPGHSLAGFWFQVGLPIFVSEMMERCFFVLNRICGGCKWRGRVRGRFLECKYLIPQGMSYRLMKVNYCRGMRV
jgi:hypothetical protein